MFKPEQGKPPCDMTEFCQSAVTHIGNKGYAYCAEHAQQRRQYGYESTRKMRVWELQLLASGQPLPSYQPLPQPKES
jgi:hypothetical protein